MRTPRELRLWSGRSRQALTKSVPQSRLRSSKRARIVSIPRSSSPTCADRSETFNRAWWPKRSIGKRSHEQRMVIAIHLTNFVAHSVSTPDYLPARSVLHRRDSRDDRSWLVEISHRLGRHLSVAGHPTSSLGVAWRASSGRRTLFACIPLLQIALQYV